MRMDVFDVKEFVELNNLQEITSPIIFQRGDVPDPKGLLSNDIFGVDMRSRKRTFAYIDLHGHFFNPHIYKAFRRLWRNIEKVINGDFYYNIDENGYIYKDEENGRTGIESIYKDWNKINWERTTGMRNERIDLLTKTKKNEVFMQYQIVIPAFYRDAVGGGSGGGEVPEIDNMYAKLIRLSSLLNERDMFDFTIHSTYYNMQTLIIDIYDYFKVKLEKKNGIIRKFLMGKNTDYCTRSVISAPLYHAESPDNMETDFEHVGVPISQICSLCYPYMTAWLKNWFENEFITNKETKLDKDGNVLTIKNPESYFSDDYIKKMMDRYIRDPEYRFKPIKVPLENGKMTTVRFTGIRYDHENKVEDSTIETRPLTVTDLLYMAAVDSTEDKHVLVTRYPVIDSYGMFFGKVRVISTLKTEVVKIGEKVYNFYPHIEPELKETEIATRFKETTIFSSSYLEGIDGDYDGDQVTLKILWSQEANAEIAKAIRQASYFVKPTGENIRQMGKEGLQTMYALTKSPSDKSRTLTQIEVDKFLAIPADKYTFSLFNDTFSDHRVGDKIVKSKYNVNDIVNLKAGEYFNKEAVKTTLGRIFFNKVIIESTGLKDAIGYCNDELVKGKFYKLEGAISDSLRSGIIQSSSMIKYLDHRDWMGYQIHALLCASFTEKTLRVPPEIKKLKKDLLTKYAKDIENGNPKVSELIENELVKAMENYLKDDSGMDFFRSGSQLSTGNNLKNIVLMRGAILNPNTGQYEIVKNALLDGMEKDRLTAHSNGLLLGAYPKSVSAADSGYLSKQLSAGMQTEVIDEDGTDCGTDKTIEVIITDRNKKDYLYRNIKVGSNTVMITQENVSKFVGKKVNMYSPMFCTHDKICRKCAGGYNNKFIGLDTNKIATSITAMNMQKFHDATIKTHEFDVDAILLKNSKKGILSNDGKNIVLEDNQIEFYVPEFYFEKNYRFAEDLGDTYSVFGIFNVGVFTNGKLSYIDTMNIPGMITINVYEYEKRKVELPGAGLTPCRVIKYYKKNKLFKNFLVKDVDNTLSFLRSVTYGKLPGSIPYPKPLDVWQANQVMNGINFGVPSIIQEVVLRVMYRDKNNIGSTFSKVIGKPNTTASEFDYQMISMRQVCQYASTFSGITFEDFDAMATTAINREREHKPEIDSPVEELFKM